MKFELLLANASGSDSEIIESLREIADAIENGMDGGVTPMGAWVIEELEDR